MTPEKDEIKQLHEKLELLLKRQSDFSREIDHLRSEIDRLKTSEPVIETGINPGEPKLPTDIREPELPAEKPSVYPRHAPWSPSSTVKGKTPETRSYEPEEKSDLEKFIGENLINKIGIAITVIGVSIGVKYAIDHNLISPLTRIILGYLFGLGLYGFSLKLKKNFSDFSAVLLSGSMAILYFITYAANNFYSLMPQLPAFVLMVAFTAFTVLSALKYDKQVIAHIGMVGAYAVPFLLGDKSSNVVILFSYVTIINTGILVIAFRKYWKPLYYASLGLTWLIYLTWYNSSYQSSEHFGQALTFLFLFFATFYGIFLAGKLLQQEKFEIDDVILLLANSFVFYGFGYSVLQDHETGKYFLGLFTFANALIHFGVSAVIYFRPLSTKNLFYLVSVLGLTFVSIAIPVQLDGNWVTLLWCAEAAFLFWIGRTYNISAYERISYPLMILAFVSLLNDWSTYNNFKIGEPETLIHPVFNINFLTSLLFISAFSFINFHNRNKKYYAALLPHKEILKALTISVSAILLFTIYFSIFEEIKTYWDQLFVGSKITFQVEGQKRTPQTWNNDLQYFKNIWLIIYSLIFMSATAFVNLKRWKNRQLSRICFVLICLVLFIFMTAGLFCLGQLRDGFLGLKSSSYYARPGVFALWLRYIALAFVVLTLVVARKLAELDFLRKKYKIPYDFLLSVSILWLLSSEMINWMDMFGHTNSYKLGLSILWGVYSLALIVMGIWKKKRHLRIGAIVWFGITLVKLFFYDISHLDTISKTIVFVSLGVLLLIISFLYNKYKFFIADELSDKSSE